MRGANGKDQIVIRNFVAFRQMYAALIEIESDDVADQHLRVFLASHHVANGCGDVCGRKGSQCDLIQQRLEGVVILAIDNRDLEPRPSFQLSPAQLDLPANVKQMVGGKAANPPPAAQPRAAGASSGRYVKIPDKYYDAATSGLDFKVQGGDQKHDIELTN